MRFQLLLLALLLLISSCYKNHLYVQHDKVDSSYLASTHVGTPDPRLKHPPSGQRIAIAWDFPLSLYMENLTLALAVRFWDNKQDVFIHKIPRKRGYISYKFQDDTEDKSKKILTYKVDIINEDGQIVSEWKHQFWKELIDFNKNDTTEITIEDVQLY